jgi:hypothetical protein
MEMDELLILNGMLGCELADFRMHVPVVSAEKEWWE